MVKLVIFDLDGTIVDTLCSLAYSVNTCLQKLGLPPNPVENYKYYAGLGSDVMLQRSLINAGDTELLHYPAIRDLYQTVFMEGCLYQVQAYDGVKETLKELKHQSIKLAVCTNKAHGMALKVLDEVFGEHYFDYILGESKLLPRKPAPDGVLKIAADLKLSIEECLYVGDTATDMCTGKAAGMFTIGVLWGFRDEEELSTNGADEIISHPSQLLNYIYNN